MARSFVQESHLTKDVLRNDQKYPFTSSSSNRETKCSGGSQQAEETREVEEDKIQGTCPQESLATQNENWVYNL